MVKRILADRYDLCGSDKPVGQGVYGEVYKAKELKLGGHAAIKFLKLDEPELDEHDNPIDAKETEELDDSVDWWDHCKEYQEFPNSMIREIAALRKLEGHPNVIKLLEVGHQPRYLAFEWIHQDLSRYVREFQNRAIPCSTIKSIMKQLLTGVAHCHSLRLMHRDLKLQNILIDQQGQVKIADFGMATFADRPTLTLEVTTLWYRAPELLLGAARYGRVIDMWSMGCIFAEICNRDALFPGDSQVGQIMEIFQRLGTPTERVWPGLEFHLTYFNPDFPKFPGRGIRATDLDLEGKDLLRQMLTYDPRRRIRAHQALKHAYFKEDLRAGHPL
jgi:serine/threonine protein kinase